MCERERELWQTCRSRSLAVSRRWVEHQTIHNNAYFKRRCSGKNESARILEVVPSLPHGTQPQTHQSSSSCLSKTHMSTLSIIEVGEKSKRCGTLSQTEPSLVLNHHDRSRFVARHHGHGELGLTLPSCHLQIHSIGASMYTITLLPRSSH